MRELRHSEKLDHDLHILLQGHDLGEKELVSVIFRAAPGATEEVVQLIQQHGGHVGHVIRGLHAVAARVPFGVLQALLSEEYVAGVEADRPLQLARV